MKFHIMLIFQTGTLLNILNYFLKLVSVGLGGSKGKSRGPKIKEYQYLLVPVPEGGSNYFSATGEFCAGF